MTQTGGSGAPEVPAVEVFEFPACPGTPPPTWNGWVETSAHGNSPENAPEQSIRAAGAAAEAGQGVFEAGRERGYQAGREAEREAQSEARRLEEDRRKAQLAGLAESFAAERDRYLSKVESEVVKLALAVAARILRREAQMDPLLLTGAVRVALGQLAGTSEAQLKVPASEVDLWTEAVALVPRLTLKLAIVAGEGMRLGDCAIESKIGTVDLGVQAQLREIERGFFDRSNPRTAKAGDWRQETEVVQDAAGREASR